MPNVIFLYYVLQISVVSLLFQNECYLDLIFYIQGRIYKKIDVQNNNQVARFFR